MNLNLIFAIFSSIGALSFFLGAFIAKRKREENAMNVRLLLGISLSLLTVHNLWQWHLS